MPYIFQFSYWPLKNQQDNMSWTLLWIQIENLVHYIDNAQGYLIPHRFFSDNAAADAFHDRIVDLWSKQLTHTG